MHHHPRRYARLLLCLLSLPIARADGIWSGGPCLSACQLWLSLVSFADMPAGLPFLEKRCTGGMAATTLYLCAELYCPDEDPVEGLRSLNESCRTINSTLPPMHVIAEYTEEDRERLKRVDAVSENGIDVYDEVVLPSESLLQLARNTLVGFGHGVAAADLELTFVGRVRSTTCKGTTMATGKCDATIVTHFIADHSA